MPCTVSWWDNTKVFVSIYLYNLLVLYQKGCKGLFSLRENISDSVYVGLNSTNQFAAQCEKPPSSH